MTLQSLERILFSQGFGARRTCVGLIAQGHVQVNGMTCDDPWAEFDPRGLQFTVRGETWAWRAQAYLMLHKPVGTECSQRPSAWPSVYTLLPGPLRQRPRRGGVPGVQAVGRLDQDTTGLLLLSDDGAFIHRMISPRHHVPKVYEVTLRHPFDAAQRQRLLEGVVLDDDPQPVRADACEATGELAMRLTITEGKYHQVKRMVAAAGNRVEALHRDRIGGLDLPAVLEPGDWAWLTDTHLAALADFPDFD